VGAAPPRAVEKHAPAQTPATSPATDLAKSDPDLVRTRDGDSIRFSDLRAYVQPIDARSRPLDDIRESAERRGQDPAPQQIWSRYEERDPAAASRAAEGVKQIQQHIDTGRYPEATPAEVTQSRFIDTAAYYLEKQRGEAPSRSEVVQDLREHYRGWAKSESAWRGYDERHGIEHTSHDHARGGEPRAIDAHAQAIETTRQPNDLTPSR
jgi:hypothetical protein